MAVTEKTFIQLALEDPGQWELHCGQLQRKQGMTAEHNRASGKVYVQLVNQLDEDKFEVRLGMGHVRRSPDHYYIPDVFVVPTELVRPLRGLQDTLEAYSAPLPLVVEVWSPSTGAFDITEKLPEYQRRGDLEIWRIHPYERTVTAWQRQPNGTYVEVHYRGGIVHPIAFPEINIDLDALYQ